MNKNQKTNVMIYHLASGQLLINRDKIKEIKCPSFNGRLNEIKKLY